RRKDVDHLGLHCRCRGDLGKERRAWRQSSRLSCRNQSSRLFSAGCAWEVVAASICYVRSLLAGCARTREQPVAEVRWIEVAADVPQPGPIWDRVGRNRRCHVLLRYRAAIFTVAQAVSRSAHRLAPTRAGEAGMDDHGNHESTVARAASWTLERWRKSSAPAHLNGEAKQCVDGARIGAALTRHSRRKRHCRRLSDYAPHDESGIGKNIRGHSRHSHTDHRLECDRNRRFLIAKRNRRHSVLRPHGIVSPVELRGRWNQVWEPCRLYEDIQVVRSGIDQGRRRNCRTGIPSRSVHEYRSGTNGWINGSWPRLRRWISVGRTR